MDLRSRSRAGRRLSARADCVTTSMMDLRDQKVEGGSVNMAAALSGDVEWTGRFVNAVILICGFFSLAGWGMHSSKSILIIPPNTHDRPNCQHLHPKTEIELDVGELPSWRESGGRWNPATLYKEIAF